MLLQGLLVAESLVTDPAGEYLSAHVLSLVRVQVARLAEALEAEAATVRLLPGVYPLVSQEDAPARENLVADLADNVLSLPLAFGLGQGWLVRGFHFDLQGFRFVGSQVPIDF